MIKRKGMNPALARMTQIRKDNMLISAAGKANMIISLMVLHDKFGYGEKRLPEEGGTYIIKAKDGEREIISFAKWQNRYKRFDMTGARAYWRIIAWRPLPEPYRPEQPETCKYTGGSCCWPIDQCSDCPNHPERSEK